MNLKDCINLFTHQQMMFVCRVCADLCVTHDSFQSGLTSEEKIEGNLLPLWSYTSYTDAPRFFSPYMLLPIKLVNNLFGVPVFLCSDFENMIYG